MEGTKLHLHEVKKLFLNNGQTQFEFLKFVFTEPELKSEKPFVLLALVYTRLSLKTTDFKPKSFRQWLKRYRSRKAVFDKPTPAADHISALPDGTDRDKFEFSDPSSLKKENTSILHYVK